MALRTMDPRTTSRSRYLGFGTCAAVRGWTTTRARGGTLTARAKSASSELRLDRGRGRDGCDGRRKTEALVSVDLGPSVVLGSSLMVSAVALYQVRASRPEVSRDKDVFFSSIGLLCGGILIFQGWRLDPLMLFGQLLTTATAVAFATETISLRQELLNAEDAGNLGGRPRGGRGRSGRRPRRMQSLPPVSDRNVDYGARREYGREDAVDLEANVYDASAGVGNNRASSSAYGGRRGAMDDRYDDYNDIQDGLDALDGDFADEESPYRDGFRTATGETPPAPRPSTGKNWESDDWDFE